MLRDGGGPLYDPRVPERSLHELIARARAGGPTNPNASGEREPTARAKRCRWAALPIGAPIAVLAGTAVAATTSTRTFTESVIAAAITADGSQSVAKIQDSLDGPGAGTTTTASSSSSYPLTGTDTNIGYFANGVQRSTDTFKIEKPNAKGISRYTARGKCTGGTRSHASVRCSFTASGTVDTNPGGVARIKVVGTYIK